MLSKFGVTSAWLGPHSQVEVGALHRAGGRQNRALVCWRSRAPEPCRAPLQDPLHCPFSHSDPETTRPLILERSPLSKELFGCAWCGWSCSISGKTQDVSHVSALCFFWKGNPAAGAPGSPRTLRWSPDNRGTRTFAIPGCWLKRKAALREAPSAAPPAGRRFWCPWWLNSAPAPCCEPSPQPHRRPGGNLGLCPFGDVLATCPRGKSGRSKSGNAQRASETTLLPDLKTAQTFFSEPIFCILEEQTQSGGGRGAAEDGGGVNLCRLIFDCSWALFISWSSVHGKRYSHCSSKYSKSTAHEGVLCITTSFAFLNSLSSLHFRRFSSQSKQILVGLSGNLLRQTKWWKTRTFGKKNLRFGTGPSQSTEHTTFKMSPVSISCHWQEGNAIYGGEPWHPNPSLKPSSCWKHLDVFCAASHAHESKPRPAFLCTLPGLAAGSPGLPLLCGMLSALGTLSLVFFYLFSTHLFRFLLDFRACVHPRRP